MRRALASMLVVTLAAISPATRADPDVEASASPPEITLPIPPPEKYLKMMWIFEGTKTKVHVYSVSKVLAIDKDIREKDRQIEYLTDKATKECIDAQIEAGKSMPRWIWIGVGIVIGSAATYGAMRATR